MTKLIKAGNKLKKAFFIPVHGLSLPKSRVKEVTVDVRKTRFL